MIFLIFIKGKKAIRKNLFIVMNFNILQILNYLLEKCSYFNSALIFFISEIFSDFYYDSIINAGNRQHHEIQYQSSQNLEILIMYKIICH